MTVQRLAGILEELGLGASEEDLRDLLWLAPKIGAATATPEASPPAVTASRDAPSEARPPVPRERAKAVPDASAPDRPLPGPEEQGEPARFVHLHRVTDADLLDGQQAIAIGVPAASALGGELQLGGALRPFMRKTASRHRKLMDEEATASRIAEEHVWLPAMRPALTRWLDLAVVVDGYESMTIWRHTITELRSLLERLGAFSDVRFWVLDHAAGDPSRPALRRWQPGSPLRSTRELLDPAGRRAIVTISDCLGPMWQSGAAQHLLAEWGKCGPVAIVQPLPQRLWNYSHARSVPVRLHSVKAGVPNAKLTFSRPIRPAGQPGRDAVPVPVLELDADWLASWSRLVSASGATGVNAMVVFADGTATPGRSPATPGDNGAAMPDGRTDKPHGHPGAAPPEPRKAQDRVRRFRATASPEAFQLSVHLAAAPISLPVIRLVQRAMQKRRRQSHVAEVFLSGLLYRIGPEDATDPDAVQYDFLPGVRDELLRRLRRQDALRVLVEVSRFVDAQFGQARDFPALLAGAGVTGDYLVDPNSRPFARIAEHVLRLLGGQYTAAADSLAAALPGTRPRGTARTDAAAPGPAPAGETPAAKRSSLAGAADDKFSRALAKISSLPGGRSRGRPLVCPYCYHEFGDRDIRFRCSGEPAAGWPPCPRRADPRQQRLGEHEPLPPVFSADGHRDDAVCPSCHGPTHVQVCPECHSRMPASFKAVQGRLVALIGPRLAGKTAFMTVLIHELRHQAGERLNSSTMAADRNTQERYPERYETPLYDHSMLPAPTTAADDYIAPLVFRFTMTQRNLIHQQQQKELLLSFTDGAGEDLSNPDKLERVARYLAAADGVMVVIDPLQLRGVRNLLRPTTRLPPPLPADERPGASFERITRLLLARSGGNMIDKPVALVLTKVDMLQPLLPEHSPLRAPAPEVPYFDALDNAAVQQQVKDALSDWNALRLDHLARDHYTRHRFFPVSALGAPPTASNQVQSRGIMPYRVTDPFMWVLSEFSFIQARAK
jgi:hypothetical protein